MPGASFSRTARVASGVTSRGLSPVPPVVRMRSAWSVSAQAMSATGDTAGFVGDEGAVHQRVAPRLRPAHDGVARGVGALAPAAGVGNG